MEVSEALNTGIVDVLTGGLEPNIKALGSALRLALDEVNPVAIAGSFMEILDWIPYQIHLPLERYYHSVIFAVLKALSFKIRPEDSTSEGRIDMRLEYSKDKLYIFEFKFQKYDPEQKTDSEGAHEKEAKSLKSQSKTKTKTELMVNALEEAQTQLLDKRYSKRDEREYAQTHKVAVGIVGRSQIGAELVNKGKT